MGIPWSKSRKKELLEHLKSRRILTKSYPASLWKNPRPLLTSAYKPLSQNSPSLWVSLCLHRLPLDTSPCNSSLASQTSNLLLRSSLSQSLLEPKLLQLRFLHPQLLKERARLSSKKARKPRLSRKKSVRQRKQIIMEGFTNSHR